jgi:hypothetical protein
MQLGVAPSEDAEPYKSGLLTPEAAPALLAALNADKSKTTIIHILRWKDPDHSTVKFDKWYLYDPTPSKSSFYLETKLQIFQSTAIPGRKDLQFVYIHLNAVLASGTSEWKAPGSVLDPTPILAHPVNYTITVTKAQTQFIQDLQTLAQILKVYSPAAAAAATSCGYYSFTLFTSQWTTSTITIAASLDSTNKTKPAASPANAAGIPANAKSASNQLTSKTYNNERPSWVGLSAGVPITSFKDITYQQTSSTLTPTSITQQNAYVFIDGYFPPVLPTLTTFRYIPHPFFGLPIKGEVFRHAMIGGSIGAHWLEPFGGVVFDTQNNQVKSATNNKTSITYQAVFGLKVSVSALGKALKSK